MSNSQTFNHLENVKFKLAIKQLPDITFWAQSCILPSMSLETSVMPGMRRDIPIPGQKATYENLIVNFIVDQELINYEQVYYWFERIATADTVSDMVSDCSLHFLDGNNKVSRTIDFVGAYPTLLTELSMNSDDSDTLPVTCSISLNYHYFKFSDRVQPVWGMLPLNV